MSVTPIKLKRPLSRSSNTNPDDVLAAKTALQSFGHYETPSYGMTPYPDEPLFDAIEGFQRQRGLRVDGVMKPGGETEGAFNAADGRAQSNEAARRRLAYVELRIREIGDDIIRTGQRVLDFEDQALDRFLFLISAGISDYLQSKPDDDLAKKTATELILRTLLKILNLADRIQTAADIGHALGGRKEALKWIAGYQTERISLEAEREQLRRQLRTQ